MMKAVRFSQFGGPEVLDIVDLPEPHPGPGQIRIAVRAAGVNHLLHTPGTQDNDAVLAATVVAALKAWAQPFAAAG